MLSIFGCPIITHAFFDQFASIVIGELDKTTGMFLDIDLKILSNVGCISSHKLVFYKT